MVSYSFFVKIRKVIEKISTQIKGDEFIFSCSSSAAPTVIMWHQIESSSMNTPIRQGPIMAPSTDKSCFYKWISCLVRLRSSISQTFRVALNVIPFIHPSFVSLIATMRSQNWHVDRGTPNICLSGSIVSCFASSSAMQFLYHYALVPISNVNKTF